MFREEVLEAQKTRDLGNVVLAQPFSIVFLVLSLICFSLLGIGYVLSKEFARKETVIGYLVPENGLSKVFSKRSGIVDQLLITEGQEVQKGDILLHVSNSESLSSGYELSDSLVSEVKEQISLLDNQRRFDQERFEQQLLSLESQINQLEQMMDVLASTQVNNGHKSKLAEKKYNNAKDLHGKGFLSEENLDDAYESYLNSLELLNSTIEAQQKHQLEISNLKDLLDSRPLEFAMRQSELLREVSLLEAQLLRLDSQYKYVEKAPEAGLVTAIRVNEGSSVNTNTPLLSIIPKNSQLLLEMLVPSKAVGFIEVGQEVNIRFDSFPYQKFGFVKGKIAHIDEALLLPNEKVLPVQISQSMYRVLVKLEQQEMTAYGKSFPFKVGLLAEADIVLEKRSVSEWLLDPIYSIRGKL